MKRRAMSVLTAVVLTLVWWVPSPLLAQPNEFDEGTPANDDAADEVIAIAEIFIEGISNHDGSIVDLVSPESYPDFFVSETYEDAVAQVENQAGDTRNRQIVVYGMGDVRRHESGHVSVKITYSGWSTDWALHTTRWYFLPDDGGYLIDAYEELAPEIPEDMTSAEADVAVTAMGLVMDDADVDAAQVLLINLQNDETFPYAVGVLTSGMDFPIAMENLLFGNYGAFDYLGVMPIEDGEQRTFAFLVEPGTTYYLQQFAVPGFDITDSTQVELLPGRQFIGTITVARE